jgi:hypothetical protein
MEVEKAVERKQAIVRPGSDLATALIEAQRQGIAMAAAKTNKEDQQAAVREFGDGAVDYVLPDGTVLATDDFQDGRRGVDLEKLAKEFPMAYVACVSPGDPFRSMKFKSAMTLLAGSHAVVRGTMKKKAG